jgi:hypothetical protein
MDYKLECASVFVYSTLFRCSCSLGLDLEFEFVKECYMSIQMEAGVGSSIRMFRFFVLIKDLQIRITNVPTETLLLLCCCSSQVSHGEITTITRVKIKLRWIVCFCSRDVTALVKIVKDFF